MSQNNVIQQAVPHVHVIVAYEGDGLRGRYSAQGTPTTTMSLRRSSASRWSTRDLIPIEVDQLIVRGLDRLRTSKSVPTVAADRLDALAPRPCPAGLRLGIGANISAFPPGSNRRSDLSSASCPRLSRDQVHPPGFAP